MRIKKTSQYIEGGAGLPSYFTEEIDTGMKWIDGKPIYRRVLTGTTPNSQTGSVNFNINVDTITMEDLSAISNSGYRIKQGYYESGAMQFSYTINNQMSVYFSQLGTTARNLPFTLVIEYTKTTD